MEGKKVGEGERSLKGFYECVAGIGEETTKLQALSDFVTAMGQSQNPKGHRIR